MTNKANTKPVLISDAKSRLADILLSVSWRDMANQYFGKSSSWLYHKLDGVKSDGSPGGGFTPQEAEQLRDALFDFARRIEKAASSLA